MPWPKGSTSDNNKLYLKDGTLLKLILLEDECSEIYYIHCVSGKNQKCKGDGCEQCAKGTKRDERGVIKVYDTADAKEKTLAMTPTLSKAIQNSIELCGGRKGFVFNMKAVKEGGGKLAYYVQGVPSTSTAPAQVEATEEEPPF